MVVKVAKKKGNETGINVSTSRMRRRKKMINDANNRIKDESEKKRGKRIALSNTSLVVERRVLAKQLLMMIHGHDDTNEERVPASSCHRSFKSIVRDRIECYGNIETNDKKFGDEK